MTPDNCGYGKTPRQFTRRLVERYGDGEGIDGMEVGVYVGNHARTILEHLPKMRVMHLVDPWAVPVIKNVFPVDGPTALKIARAQLEPFADKIIWMECPFSDVAGVVPRLDFCYIDGSHEYPDVVHDLEKARDLLKPDGMLGGHDAKWGDVERAVFEYAGRYNLAVHTADNGRNELGDDEGVDWWVTPK